MRLWFSWYLTPWSRVLHCVKPEGVLPWSRVTRFHLLFLSWIKWIQPMLCHPTKIHFNILPSMRRSSSGLFMFPHQGPAFISIHFSNPPTMCARHLWFDHQNSIWWWVQIKKLLIIKFFPVSYYFSILAQLSSSVPCSWLLWWI